MITMHELVLYDAMGEERTHLFNTDQGWQVFKRTNFVEVVYKDEVRKQYTATCYPWFRVARLSSYGTLERGRK